MSTLAPKRVSPGQVPRGRTERRRAERSETWVGYGFLAPTLVLLGVFVLVPLVWALLISFQHTDGFGRGTYVGLDNYRRLVSDARFWRATLNTLLFTVLVTPASMALGLAVALLFNTVMPARALFRSVLILPMAVSGVATALTGLLVFDQDNGLLNLLLRSMHLPAADWQSDGVAAFASVVLVTLWWRVGFNMLIYLAGLQGVDPNLLEAATLDGAGRWRRLRHIVVPLLGPSSFFLLIVNVIYSFQVFDIVFVLTGGGPQDATSVLVTYAYDTGFPRRDQGYGAAIGIVLLLFTLVFTAVQWRTNHRRDVVE